MLPNAPPSLMILLILCSRISQVFHTSFSIRQVQPQRIHICAASSNYALISDSLIDMAGSSEPPRRSASSPPPSAIPDDLQAAVDSVPRSVLQHVIDVHCHPTDSDMTMTHRVADEMAVRVCAMATRRSDQKLVADLAHAHPDKVIPCFGWCPLHDSCPIPHTLSSILRGEPRLWHHADRSLCTLFPHGSTLLSTYALTRFCRLPPLVLALDLPGARLLERGTLSVPLPPGAPSSQSRPDQRIRPPPPLPARPRPAHRGPHRCPGPSHSVPERAARRGRPGPRLSRAVRAPRGPALLCAR